MIIAPRCEHSRKPDEFYHRVTRLVPGPYLDLFAREQRAGWTAWGDETNHFAPGKDVNEPVSAGQHEIVHGPRSQA